MPANKEREINWPEGFLPENSPVHVRNELFMKAPAAKVWDKLIHAALWPEWYSNSANVVIPGDASGYLKAGTKFTWRTFGVNLQSEIIEYVPGRRIAWTAKAFGIWAYHAWLIDETEAGAYVLTEETQHGWIARAGSIIFPRRMHRLHQVWLEQLEKRAAGK
jgi:uncharacterized protein YndB with AHSA1/START domain